MATSAGAKATSVGPFQRQWAKLWELTPKHQRNAATPFEIIYSISFITSLAYLVRQVASVLSDNGTGFDEYSVFLVPITIAVGFQFLRMYYYLHGFDHIDSLGPETLRLRDGTGMSYLTDRVLRLLLAFIIVFAIKSGFDLSDVSRFAATMTQGLIRGLHIRNDSTAHMIPTAVASIAIRLSCSMAFAFVLLIIWDLNNYLHLSASQNGSLTPTQQRALDEARRFYYLPANSPFAPVAYFSTLKFGERLLGFLGGLISIMAFSMPSYLLAAAVGISILVFIVVFCIGQQRQKINPLWKALAYVLSPILSLFGYAQRLRP